jgi:alanyl-tRNA synthetase
VLRRILRRAVRHGYLLGIREPFMYRLVDTLGEIMGGQYPYIVEKADTVKEQIRMEEERFFRTIASGLELFEKELAHTKDVFSGEVAFKLYDTYGFPLDLTQDMLREKGIEVDIAGFERLMKAQRERAKAAWKGSGDAAVEGDFKALLETYGPNEFVGYETTETDTKVMALLDADFKSVRMLPEGSEGWVFLERTPFYAESGGQCGDIGRLEGVAEVLDTKKFFDLNLSKISTTAPLHTGDTVHAAVDESRYEIAKHHSATHLLHSALKKILGEHVNQAGSLVEANRLRFDFSHPKALSRDEVEKIENYVNEVIARGVPVKTDVMAVDEAKAKGAMALFGEKYGDEVRVVSMGDVSMELCGGTHVDNAAAIGAFFITRESGVSAGVRRIEAVAGRSAVALAKSYRETVAEVSEAVKNRDPLQGIKRLKEEVAALKQELKSLSQGQKKSLSFEQIGTTEVAVDVVEAGDIKQMIDEIKNQKSSVAVMLFQKKGDKVLLAAGVKNAPIKAGAWIKEIAPILGGGGGGRDDFAQAGGKDASKLAEAMEAAKAYARKALQG